MLTRIFGNLFYHWPEKLVIIALSLMVSITIFVTLAQAGLVLYQAIVTEQSFLNHNAFIKVFGAFMTVLIAMEFNHTVFTAISGATPTVKVRAVLLVSLLALARKVVLIDLNDYAYTSIISLAVLLAGVTLAYWVVARFEPPTEDLQPVVERLRSLFSENEEKKTGAENREAMPTGRPPRPGPVTSQPPTS